MVRRWQVRPLKSAQTRQTGSSCGVPSHPPNEDSLAADKPSCRGPPHLLEGEGAQRLAPYIALRGGAECQSRRALIVRLEHGDDIVAAKGPAKFLHDDTA